MKALIEMRVSDLLAEFAAGRAAPAAGSAAAFTGALAAALVEMVARLTVEKADLGTERLRVRYGPYRSRAEELVAAAAVLRGELEALVQEDAVGVEALVRHRSEAPGGIQSEGLLRQSVDIPMRTARAALQVAEYAEELFAQGYQSAAGDADVAARLALSAAESALAIVAANLADARLDGEWAQCASNERRLLSDRLLPLLTRHTKQQSPG